MITLTSFIIVLGLLIFVHELGHFLVAKFFRVKVLKFSLGFGPKIWSRQYGETEYLISILPLGGYVKMYGENPRESVDQEDISRAFSHKPLLQRFLIVLAGPVFNLIFPVLLFFLIFISVGIPAPVETTAIGRVAPDSPAQEVGFKPGDQILAINGQETGTWKNISELIQNSKGREIEITILRQGEILNIKATPEMRKVKNIFGEEVKERYMLGITKKTEIIYEDSTILKAFSGAVSQTVSYIHLTILGIIKIFQQVVPTSELGGPILIAQLAGQQMKAGMVDFFYFVGLISINLGIINLFPIPVLDGGHLALFSLEAIRKKQLEEQTLIIIQQIGLILLGSLMVLVFYNDIIRIIK
ncbi:MAG: RIP metalloprotease RseP [Thermodesulfobacteriota bacterium]